ALGWGGAVDRLVRTRVGRFALADALAWRDLEEAPAAELWARVLPPDAALAHLPAARLDAGGARGFVHGQPSDLVAPVAARTRAPRARPRWRAPSSRTRWRCCSRTAHHCPSRRSTSAWRSSAPAAWTAPSCWTSRANWPPSSPRRS